jgi:hypothetical protein
MIIFKTFLTSQFALLADLFSLAFGFNTSHAYAARLRGPPGNKQHVPVLPTSPDRPHSYTPNETEQIRFATT